jgi:hypothetical protein
MHKPLRLPSFVFAILLPPFAACGGAVDSPPGRDAAQPEAGVHPADAQSHDVVHPHDVQRDVLQRDAPMGQDVTATPDAASCFGHMVCCGMPNGCTFLGQAACTPGGWACGDGGTVWATCDCVVEPDAGVDDATTG